MVTDLRKTSGRPDIWVLKHRPLGNPVVDGLCQLTIYDIMRHQGNWSCQVKLESNGSYVNATGSPLQLLVLASDWKDRMMSPINR